MLLRLHIKQLPVVGGMSRSPCCVPISRAVLSPVPQTAPGPWSSLPIPPFPREPHPGAARCGGAFSASGGGSRVTKFPRKRIPPPPARAAPGAQCCPAAGGPPPGSSPAAAAAGSGSRRALPQHTAPAVLSMRLRRGSPAACGRRRAARRAQPPPGDAPRRLLLRAGPERRRLDRAGAHGGGRGQAGDLRPAGAGWSSPSPARPPAAAGRDGAGAGPAGGERVPGMRGDGPACGERGPQAARRAGVLGAAHLWGLTALRGLRGLREPRLRAFPSLLRCLGKGKESVRDAAGLCCLDKEL